MRIRQNKSLRTALLDMKEKVTRFRQRITSGYLYTAGLDDLQ